MLLPLSRSSGPGGGGVGAPEGPIRDERQAEEQTEGGAESSADSGKGGEAQVREGLGAIQPLY